MLEEAKTKRIDQKIGEIEVDRLKPSPPFNNVTVDLAGPFRIKYKEKKVWALIYLCNNSKALHLQTVENTTAKGHLGLEMSSGGGSGQNITPLLHPATK